MLSLGTEITTRHGHSIDNLFVDGNGCLVVAEMKRGASPRDVTAQVIDYAAHVSRLKWPDLDPICHKRHGTDLETAFRQCFGRSLVQSEKIEHRLLVLAESYDPRVLDAALYLINTGTPLALLQFAYFEIDGSTLFEVRVVLGEIPDQLTGPDKVKVAAGAPDEGYTNWLFSSVAKNLPEIAKQQGWVARFRINKQSLPFVSDAWPTSFGDCQLRLDVYKKDAVSLRLSVRKDGVPGLREFLEGRRDGWADAFPAEFANPPYPTVYTELAYSVPMPKVGDAAALRDIVERTEKMAGALVSLLDEYFAGPQAGKDDPEPEARDRSEKFIWKPGDITVTNGDQ
jgi:hypothetical protein